jgi:hypothetical protein
MTLGDILTEIEAQIGRAPSDLAVTAAQDEIAVALDAYLPRITQPTVANHVTTAFPGLYIYGILAHHAALIADEQGAAIWRATFEQQKRIARASMLGEGVAARPVPRVHAPGATP